MYFYSSASQLSLQIHVIVSSFKSEDRHNDDNNKMTKKMIYFFGWSDLATHHKYLKQE